MEEDLQQHRASQFHICLPFYKVSSNLSFSKMNLLINFAMVARLNYYPRTEKSWIEIETISRTAIRFMNKEERVKSLSCIWTDWHELCSVRIENPLKTSSLIESSEWEAEMRRKRWARMGMENEESQIQESLKFLFLQELFNTLLQRNDSFDHPPFILISQHAPESIWVISFSWTTSTPPPPLPSDKWR